MTLFVGKSASVFWGFCEFYSCTLCCKSSRWELFTKISYPPPVRNVRTWHNTLSVITQESWRIGTNNDLKTEALWCLQSPVLLPRNDEAYAMLCFCKETRGPVLEFFHGDKASVDIFSIYSQDFSNLLESENLVCAAAAKGIHPGLVQLSHSTFYQGTWHKLFQGS